MRELKRDLPVGTVTFLFTDIEGSTPLVAKIGPRAFRDVLEHHNQLIRDAVAAHHGVDAGTAGDSFLLVFQDAVSAVAAAIDAQRALAAATWPAGAEVRVRMGLHTGQGIAGGDGYVGLDIHRAARIAAAAHGGQVLLSEASRAASAQDLPPGVGAMDLGQHDLRGLAEPERIYQLMIEGLASDFPPLRSSTTPRTPLPAQLTTFVGRERELAEVTAMLQADRLVTLVGVGGIGKTRMMIQAAGPVARLRRHGACFVELAPITGPGLVQAEVARALGVEQEPGRPISDALVDFLRAKDILLLLDNCEHVIDAASELAQRLLESCPTLQILASSREPLGIGGETIFTVPSLELPDALDPRSAVDESGIAQIGRVEAVRLFVDRARAVLPAFGLDSSNVSAVVQICRRLDGIPLALELASARVAVMSAKEIAARLGDRFRLLTGGGRAAVPRQQTLQAAIDWSWDLLTDSDRRCLRCLSVFVGGWTLDAATAVTNSSDAIEALDALGRLVARSLVFLDRSGPTRYGMLETIRQYANAKLVESDEAEGALGRHLAHYSNLAAEAESALEGPDMVAWLQRLDPEAENLRAALGWAFDSDAGAAIEMSLSMRSYWRLRSVGSEGLERLDQAVDLARLLLPAEGSPVGLERSIVLARTLATAAQAHALWADAIVARDWADEALVLARRTGDERALSLALSAAFLVAVFSSQLDGVDRAAEALRDVAARQGDWWSLVYVYWVAAEIARHDDPALAMARVEEATDAARRSGNPATIAFAALARGAITSYVAGLADARPWFEQAIAGYRAIGDRRFEVIAQSDLAHAVRHGGTLDEAEALYGETIREWLHLGNRGALANQLESFAYLAIARGYGSRAARLLGAAEALREVAGSPMQAMGTEHEDYETAVAQIREGPDRETVDAAWAEGRRLTAEAAVEAALKGPAAGRRGLWTGSGHVVDTSAGP